MIPDSESNQSLLGKETSTAPQVETDATDIKLKRLKKILLWIFFGFLFSFVPIIWSIVFHWLIGYDFSLDEHKVEYLIDFFLAIFAVATNACSCAIAWDITRRSMNIIARGIFIGFTAACMTASTITYAYFFNVPEKLRYDRINIVFYIAVALGFVNFLIGLYISWKDS